MSLGPLLALVLGCQDGGATRTSGPPAPAPAPIAVDEPAQGASDHWSSEVLLDTGSKLSGVAIGDLLPEHEGNELVAVGTDHRMHLCWREGDAWQSTVIATPPGEMIQVAVGDLDRKSPGDEILAVGVASGNEDDPGARGAAILVRRVDGAWTTTQVLEDSALCHGVCVDGAIGWVSGYGRRVHRLLGGRGDGAVNAETPGPGRSLAAALGGVVIACRDGAVLRAVVEADGSLAVDLVDRREAGRARIAAAGDDLLVADDDGTLSLLTRGGREAIYQASDKLRGAVLADLDRDAPGLEAATAGYDGTIRVFTRGDAGWTGVVAATDSNRFHHLTAGTLPGFRDTVLVGVNYSGRVTVAWKRVW